MIIPILTVWHRHLPCAIFSSCKTGEEPLIAFSGMIGRSENLIMAKVLEIPLVPLEIVDLSEYGVVCMLDTQPGTGNNSFDPACRR